MDESNKHNIREHKEEKLNLGALFLGLMLIVIGLAYFAKASGLVPLPFFNLIYNWPVFIFPILVIFVGLSMLRTRNVFAKIFGIIFVFILVALLSGVFFIGHGGNWNPEEIGGNYPGSFFRMPCFDNFDNTEIYPEANRGGVIFRNLR